MSRSGKEKNARRERQIRRMQKQASNAEVFGLTRTFGGGAASSGCAKGRRIIEQARAKREGR